MSKKRGGHKAPLKPKKLMAKAIKEKVKLMNILYQNDLTSKQKLNICKRTLEYLMKVEVEDLNRDLIEREIIDIYNLCEYYFFECEEDFIYLLGQKIEVKNTEMFMYYYGMYGDEIYKEKD